MKCAIEHCVNDVGPIRARKTKLCYVCDRNIQTWESRPVTRMLNWQRRVKMFADRLSLISKAQPARKVTAFVKKEAEKRAE